MGSLLLNNTKRGVVQAVINLSILFGNDTAQCVRLLRLRKAMTYMKFRFLQNAGPKIGRDLIIPNSVRQFLFLGGIYGSKEYGGSVARSNRS
jgi:hypothetical protein